MTNNNTRSDLLSQIYHSLRAPRRRILVRLIARSDNDSLSVRTCARHVTAVENGIQPQVATGEQYRNVYNALSQTHLSTLSEAGLVIYDPDRQTVSAGPNLQLGVLIISLNEATYQTLQGQHSTDIE
jgi:DNA-binding transcriptional ArsR family regulator